LHRIWQDVPVPGPAAPQHHPTPRELDDLELLTIGALAPVTRFNEPDSLVTLELPPELVEAGAVELVDPEGLPLAVVRTDTEDGWEVEALTHAQFGPFRRLYLTPAETRERYAGRTFVPVSDALTDTQLAELDGLGPVTLLALVGDGTPALPAVGLLRASLTAAAMLPDATVVAVPLAAHGDPEGDHALGVQVVANYAGDDDVHGLATEGELPPEIAHVVDFYERRPDEQGLVLFFTGLSGSGKSTLARALTDRILEQGSRTVTSLDGDVVRRNLSTGLTFSKEDRETNIRRIGWVAAEISRHSGIAVCSPIAPFDDTRQQVRAMVDAAGGSFFLVHVATPLEECERRDRKGLYAKARRGEIPEFTGISSPYQEPDDADVRVDTTGRSIEDALDDVIAGLRDAGYLDLTDPSVVEVRGARRSSRARTGPPKPRPLNVLFVCTANICRSPFMEITARELAGPDAAVEFSSAGTHGFTEYPMDTVMAGALTERGLSADEFLSRPLTAELIDDADLVITAEASHRAFILDDHAAAFRKVFTLGQVAEVVRTSPDTLTGPELLQALGDRRGASEPHLDVRDPYGRGPKAAEEAAQQIDELLRVVVPALVGREAGAERIQA
jgi:sulfate adenylyltransferase